MPSARRKIIAMLLSWQKCVQLSCFDKVKFFFRMLAQFCHGRGYAQVPLWTKRNRKPQYREERNNYRRFEDWGIGNKGNEKKILLLVEESNIMENSQCFTKFDNFIQFQSSCIFITCVIRAKAGIMSQILHETNLILNTGYS